MKFFVSYTSRDLKWAKWITWELENARQRYQCVVQFRDFAPGMNFMQKMRQAAEAECTLALFSTSYFRSDYCCQEMDAALTGSSSRLLPVMIERCNPGAFLRNRIYIDLTETSWDDSRERLLSGVEAYVTQTLGRGRGSRFQKIRPAFPRAGAPLEPSQTKKAPAIRATSGDRPLKVLFVGPEVGGLNPRGQLKAMQQAVERSRHPKSVVFKGIFKADIGTLFEGLNRELPDVFHFSGKQSGGDILMRTAAGALMTVPDTALAGIFRSLDTKPLLVVIDTCYSLRCASTIARAVPCTLGVEADPYETEMVDFYSIFYQAIASGRSIKDAAGQAQSGLAMAQVPGNRIPKLRCQPGINPASVFLVKPT